MTVYPGQQPSRPRRTLLWAAIACFVAGLALTGLFVNRAIQGQPQEPQWADSGEIHLDTVGLTVYSSIPVLRAPCDVRGDDGVVLELRPPESAESLTVGDDTWFVVARSITHVPAGDYTANCTDDKTDAVYAIGPRATETGFAYSVLAAITSFLVGTALAIVFGILYFTRSKRRPHGSSTG